MTCARCQREIPDGSGYCSFCGAPQTPPADRQAGVKRLRRPAAGRKIAGVCAGFAEYFEVDVTLVRLAWLVLSILPGAVFGGIVAYLVAWFIMPKAEAPTGTVSGSAAV